MARKATACRSILSIQAATALNSKVHTTEAPHLGNIVASENTFLFAASWWNCGTVLQGNRFQAEGTADRAMADANASNIGSSIMLIRSALLAGLIVFTASSAYAQDTEEQIQVTAPHYRAQSTPLNGPLEKISLSSNVRYDDLNLRTRSGARELRLRVRDEAQDVCMQLAENYAVREAPGTSCYKDALDDAMLRANTAIREAREYRTYND
jgi:UrcA family protein